MRRLPACLLALSAALLGPAAGTSFAATSASAASPEAKISPSLARALAEAPDGNADILVVLAEQADLSASRYFVDKAARGRFVYERLTATAAATQGDLLAELARLGAPARPYWAANFVWTRGDATLAGHLAERADVARLDANPRLVLEKPIVDPAADSFQESPDAVEWNLTWVNADDVWALGHTGQGAVIAGQDTGYQWDHPALKSKYRGWNGASADHNYNWHDAIHSGGGSCGANATAPCDDSQHGTHTMGTMVGNDGGANQVGMAPGAKWIGCRNMDQGNGTPTTYIECFQWFIAPTNVAGGSPDPSKAPDVINNSWGCPTSEGCNVGNFAVMQTVVENVRAAGIFVAVSAGNSGSGCSTVNTPAAIYDASFSVGATGDHTDAIASYSSRGPVTVDGSNRMKPDISAPGSNIRSSIPGSSYQGGWDGTSMAGPHVAGLVGLLISAVPSAAGDVDRLEAVIRDTAVHPTFAGACSVAAGVFPNNTFGSGRIDALAAVNALLSQVGFTVGASPGSVSVCAPDDATFTVNVGQFGAFDDPVTLSVTGEPSGTTEGFSVNPVTPPGSSTLTLSGTGAASPGTYPLTIVGTAPGPATQEFAAELRIFDSEAGAATPTAPADGTTGVAVLPTLAWSAGANATSYLVEVSDDETFATIDYSATTSATSHPVGTPLAPSTEYFWRVTADNVCGSTASATFSFTTANIVTACSGAITIVDAAAATPYPAVASVSLASGPVVGVEVKLLDFTHTYPDDVDMLLVSPGGAKMIFASDAGGGGDVSAIDLTLLDGAATLLPDTGPLATGQFRPSDVESGGTFPAPAPGAPYSSATPVGTATFLGTFGAGSPNGDWKLYIVDDAGQDSGSVAQFCVSLALGDSMPFLDGFESQNTSAWSQTIP